MQRRSRSLFERNRAKEDPKTQRTPQRMKKIGTPLLVIGLGGTGTDALRAVRDAFERQFVLEEGKGAPPHTAYLAIDTDRESLHRDRGYRLPCLGGVCCLPTNLQRTVPPYIGEWLDLRSIEHQIGESLSVRQAGRYWLFRHADESVFVLRQILTELLRLRVDESGFDFRMEIVLLTGVTGGVGSGMFLDMPYLIRYVMRTFFREYAWRTTAYVFTPDVQFSRFGDGVPEDLRQRMEANAFAAFKELDFWMNAGRHGHTYAFTQQYSETISVAWDEPPFDSVVLLDSAKPDGTPIPKAYESAMALLGKWLVNLYADEPDGILMLHHLDAPNLTPCQRYPGVEAYMGVSVSECEDQADTVRMMVGKRIFDRMTALSEPSNVSSLAGTSQGDALLRAFQSDRGDVRSRLEARLPLPTVLTTRPYPTAAQLAEKPLHGDMFEAWLKAHPSTAKEVAADEIRKLRERFFDGVKYYATNLRYGPFETLRAVRKAEDEVRAQANAWEMRAQNARCEREVALSEARELYAKVARRSILKTYVPEYIESCRKLYAAARDQLLAEAVAGELRSLLESVTVYVGVRLPKTCKQIQALRAALAKRVQELSQAPAGVQIASGGELMAYVEQRFDEKACDQATERALEQVMKWCQAKRLFFRPSSLWREMAPIIAQEADQLGTANMDRLLDAIRPDGEPYEYLNDVLERVILPMEREDVALRLRPGFAEKDAACTFLFVPENADRLCANMRSYAANVPFVAFRRSSVADRISWVKARRCSLFEYAGLGRLEEAYEAALEQDHPGLHLVSKPWDPRRTLANDWSLLASPVMHEIVGQPMPPTVKQRRRTIAGLLKTGIETGFISLESSADEESLSITLRQPDGEDKTITITYPSYTGVFARAHGLDPNAAEGAQTARRLAAEYVLYAWYPHLVDQLRAQCDTLFTGT